MKISSLFKYFTRDNNNLKEDNFLKTAHEAYAMGEYQLTYGNKSEALKYFDKAIFLGIKEAHNGRAFCRQQLGLFKEALEDFYEAIKLTPEDANLYYGSFECKMELNDYWWAISDLHKAIEISKLDTLKNTEYNLHAAQNLGVKSLTKFFEIQLFKAQLKTEEGKDLWNKISPEDK